VIADEYVDPTFGTGCLKITPAHDINDYELGKKFNLPSIDLFNENGTLNAHGLHYEGVDRFECRKRISMELQEKGYLVKTEDYINKVGFSERTNAVIEPKLSMQWFLSMKELAQPALDHVMNDDIRFFPDKFKNTYRHWMENVKDWCISRQLWWGHQIPAWYYGEGANDFVVAASANEAIDLLKSMGIDKTVSDIKQDEDVLDTWFSSWLWPISVFNGITSPNNPEIRYYYPTNDLVTAPEIMFFWVARMIIAGYEYLGDLPFKNVYYTGIVRDKLGRKMSKSLGNSPDPIDLINQFGADGVRMGILISSPAGNDLPFDTSQCEQGRNFANKIWNAYRLVSGWEVREFDQPVHSTHAIAWFQERLNESLIAINDHFDKFRISDALMETYKLIWDDFCSWYLEMIKPGYEQPIDLKTLKQTKVFFEKLMQMLHPFMPFISEELWHTLNERGEGDDIIISSWPLVAPVNENILTAMNEVFEIISGIRNFRKSQNIAQKVKLTCVVASTTSNSLDSVLLKMGNLSELKNQADEVSGAHCFIVKGVAYYIPFGEFIDVEGERAKILEEIKYTQGFLAAVQGKLSNERFVAGAPEQVVALERQKEADAMQKLALLESRLSALK
jgi:valyl-tRNA synthetase